jgi:hypothetical protein
MITALLNGYRRTENLDRQIEALRQQTVIPTDVMIWHNRPGPDKEFNMGVSGISRSAYCNVNLGVWARFAYALNAKTDFVCVFDDDTIPGPRWFENCLATMAQKEALLGTIGLLYDNPPQPLSPEVSYYNKLQKIGWNAVNNNAPVEVDLVGHAWFFKRSWLSLFWRELPDPKFEFCGEDMHFSFMLQKYLGIPTFVPPHPPDQKDLWGSVQGQLGVDDNSLWEKNAADASGTPFRLALNDFFIQQRRKGWKLVNEQ